MQTIAIVVSLTLTVVAVALIVLAVRNMLSVIRAGQPAIGHRDRPAARFGNMLKETVGHTRMLQWTWVGIMHWLVFAGFIYLSTAVLAGYFQIFDAHAVLPIIGSFFVFEWITEALSWLTVIGIVYLIVVRQRNHPRKQDRKSRFFGSTFWQAYFVEAIILGEGIAGLVIRGLEFNLVDADRANAFHFPLTAWFGQFFSGLSQGTVENLIHLTAMAKIAMATVWLIVLARNITMGVAWHRFTAWFNIYFKRESDGGTALGGLAPLYINNEPLDLEKLEDLEEEDFSKLGTGKVEDFTWKGLLDFTTCTECGRCQSQCPAWNTEKPLSPKLLVMGLREHAYAKIPLLDKDEDKLTEAEKAELERPLIGDESMFGVIDPDVLWSCTNCGACVQQCPVDIEHVDHIDNMRRYQVLVESNFPTELNNIFKGLERKGNPWNMNPRDRLKWTDGLDFEVKQVGVDVEDLDEVDWLFWVGCAGAYEDRAKKTTQAVAELLNMAGVDFAVLGDGETCTGDPARRAGNEIVFAQLAMQNTEVFKEMKVKKVVSTCAHCFNTLKNEYKEFGVELEVVHHTQLLNRLVREGRLTPVAAPSNSAAGKTITYHDPCFLGRHNQVYEPPRELLNVIPGATFKEMPRNGERSFCCGAGGARMWMEETLGSRINVNRTEEAIATGADQIAVACPFCRVMLADGLTAKQSEGAAREEVEVLDVAQLLLASVKRAEVGVEDGAGGAVASTGGDPATEAEPNAADKADPDSISDTSDAAPLATAAEDAAADDTTGASLEELDNPAPGEPGESKRIAAEHNIEVDESDAGHLAPPIPTSESTPAEGEPTADDTQSEETVADPDANPSPDETLQPTADEPAEKDARDEESETLPDVDRQQPETIDDQHAEWKEDGGALPPPEDQTESNG